MKKFIGTKEVLAEPMMEGIAYANGWARKGAFVDDNHNGREGYHVQYVNPDGSTYDSWSPKDVFEKTYKIADTFVDRLKNEYEELTEKCEKLNRFLEDTKGDGLKEISTIQYEMLVRQSQHMNDYRSVLGCRLYELGLQNMNLA